MKLLEYLDRRGERRLKLKLARPPFDTRFLIGGLFLFGYYSIFYALTQFVLPAENVALVRDMLLILGPAVGAIVGAIFRSERRDDQATANTGKALDTIEAAIAAPAGPQKVATAAADRVADAAADEARDIGGTGR